MNFFSFTAEKLVVVQPEKQDWDLNFTVFTNEIEGFGSYGYADFVVINHLAGVQAYKMEQETKSYSDFAVSDVEISKFLTDQRAIGSDWRKGGGPDALPSLNKNVFFIIKDTEGNLYKLKFTGLLDESGARGYPAFEYCLLEENN